VIGQFPVRRILRFVRVAFAAIVSHHGRSFFAGGCNGNAPPQLPHTTSPLGL
jgi:hypothetical protein